MKAGLFGGDWDDISDAIDDHFGGLAGGAPDLAPSPGPDARFGLDYPFEPNSPATPAGIGGPIVMNASSNFGTLQAGARALEAMAPSAGTPVQSMVLRPERDKETGAVMPPVETLLADPGANTGSTDMAADGTGGAPAAAPAAKAPSIDQGFLAGREGGQQLQAYQPDPLKQPAPPTGKDPGASVGITVATGVDLGAHTADDLRRWRVSEDGIAALTPAMGLKGNAARDYAAAGLPSISTADAQAMDQGALNDIVSKVQQAYDATNPATKFADMHPDAQTAIVSLAYQYGPNLAVRTPNFWKDVTSGDLGGAVGELRNFHDAYPTRRNQEADRMQRGIGVAPGAPLQLLPTP